MTVFLNQMGVACALGIGAEAVRAALWRSDGPAGGELTERYTPGECLHLGTAPLAADAAAALPADTPVAQRTRNNAMLLAALEPLRAAVDAAVARHGPARVAVVLGTSTSGIAEGERAVAARAASGTWPAGYVYGQQELGSPAHFLARLTGARGPAYVLSTACSSSAKAMAAAARLLACGAADAVLCGGVDTLCGFTIAGFRALESVSPQRCLPLSANRAGIHLGEGAALFLMTREAGPVRLAGWGESADAYHISAPEPGGQGARTAMAQALARAGIDARAVDYVNLHGTATPQNDAMELPAVAALLGSDVPVSSTKPLTGHALGAAGAIEAALLWLTLVDNPQGRLPPHWWDGVADPALPPQPLVAPGDALGRAPRYLMSNSFAFGGSNGVLLLDQG
ncbi:beta-ketoacyl-[acyl-carrier-protein] synthase II [Cupriavidus sp. USMAA2-4]|uniref:Beta-ketoacyl-[acyl-carrier-protein] synthase II n=1 Tax=Cupriavidus malaysiensis TaxID=367825 RepID=A0ABM6FDD6_9BURK|nr:MULTISPECIES: beta-ketoacyl-ACP synthase [Cupriavidus]AOY96777.1 beta-ketoacyl-[acyl-carrier-protein] synthase II [Cupriavidus sp. USMAA2-4]AOZ02819.1 beta-ketoacyl-[acyl-carrier-protein] synthase II [Cupriavidus sp. USMAHM13]AOZ09809.1 beta-ketoacyl-[acyl-carrier-protein] synthase II [Cupriavidus malaysiensis]